MNQQSSISKFKEMGFAPVSNVKDGVLLKSKNGVVLTYNDGNYEGFIKQKQLDEVKLTEAIGLLTIIGLLTTYFTTDITIVRGVSMMPTLTNNQVIVKSRAVRDVNKLLLSKNAIVKFKSPQGDTSVKRIIGIPGDEIEVGEIVSKQNGKPIKLGNPIVKVNGKVFDTCKNNPESQNKNVSDYYKKYFTEKGRYNLKPNQYFVMGDNKNCSIDSREYGPIEGYNIISVLKK